jgi:hypothetical protein
MSNLTTLTEDEQEAIKYGANEIGATIRSYSGRYMYGESCLGIVVSNVTDLATFVLMVNEDDPDLADHLARNACMDSMGYDYILYWQRIAWTEAADDDDE